MSLFHKHVWKLVSTSFTPPMGKFSADKIPMSAFKTLTQGVTHIYQKCERCGEIRERFVYGKFTGEEVECQ